MLTKEICLISVNCLQTENASRNRLLSFINGYINHGYKVKLISMDLDNYKIFDHPNFEHYKIPTVNTKISSFTKRAILEIQIAKKAIKIANSLNCELNLITIPSMFLLQMSFLLNKNTKKILDIRDLSWEYISEKSLFSKLSKRILKYGALINIKNFDIISVTNTYEKQYLNKIILKNQSIIMVPNGVSEETYSKLSSLKNISHTNPTITYIGNIGLAQDLSTLVEIAKAIPDIKINIGGTGTDFSRIKNTVNSNDKNINLLGQLKLEEILEIYSRSDILYAQLTPDFSTAMPSKLYEYLATGKYILYAGEGVAVETLNQFENLSIVPPCNINALKFEILKILKDESYKNISNSNKLKINNEYLRDKTVNKLILSSDNLYV